MTIAAGGGYNAPGAGVKVSAGLTSTWSAAGSSAAVVLDGGPSDSPATSAQLKVHGKISSGSGMEYNPGGPVEIIGGNGNAAQGGNIILMPGAGSPAGNVGIGTNSPGTTLHVLSQSNNIATFASPSGVSSVLTIQNDAVTEQRTMINFNSWSSGNSGLRSMGNIGFVPGGHISIETSNNGNTGGERLRITAAGDIGIGTANPGAKLEVAGSVKITDGTQGAGKVLTSDSSGLASWQAVSGDNLGNHTAAMALQMGPYAVNTSSHVNAGAYQIAGTKVLAVLPGIDSLGVGLGAGRVDTGNNNVFVGYRAGYSNTNGFSNTFLGQNAGYSNTTAYNNTYVGQNVGYFNTTGIMNSMLGAAAGYSNTTGSNNTFMGDYAGNYNQTGSANALFGFGAGGYGAGSVNSFSSSTVVGYKAGYMLGNGSADNTLIGFQAGDSLTNGSNNIIIGYNQDATAPASSNELNIGGAIYGNLSTGNIGIGVASPGAKLEVAGNVKIADGTQGAGKVLTSDSSGLASWQAVSGDNLGNHTATTGLNMAGFPVFNVSSLTMVGGGLSVLVGTSSFSNGLFITNTGGLYTQGYGGAGSTYAPAARGTGAVDLQSFRVLGADRVSAGNYSTIAGGIDNKIIAGSINGFIGAGDRNTFTSGVQNSVIVGGYNNVMGGSHAFIGGGYGNTANSAYSVVAGGGSNIAESQHTSIIGGYVNSIDAWSSASSIIGGSNNAVIHSDYALAGGFNARSSWASGAFTWADSQGTALENAVADRTVFKNRGGFLITGSTNTAVGGTVNRGVFISGDGLVGISTGSPKAAIDVVAAPGGYAQIWRDSSGSVVSSMSAAGVLYPQSAPAGDNLGNHIAGTALDMAGNAINSAGNINGAAAIKMEAGGIGALQLLAGNTLTPGQTGGAVTIAAGGGYNAPGAGVKMSAGLTSTWAAAGSSAAVVLDGGPSDSPSTSAQIKVHGKISAGSGSPTNPGGPVEIIGGNGNSAKGGNIILMPGAGAPEGYVGIGTANPQAKLHVNGSLELARFDSTGVSGYAQFLYNGSPKGNIGYTGNMSFFSSPSPAIVGAMIIQANDGIQLGVGSEATLNITNTNLMGVGTSAPAAKLDVQAAGSASSDMAQIWRNSGGVIVSSVSATGVLSAAAYEIGGSPILARKGTTLMNGLGVGKDAGAVSTADSGVFIGYQAGYKNVGGIYNIAVGEEAGHENAGGNRNISIGYQAGYSNTTFHDNLSIGTSAGSGGTGSANVMLGNSAGAVTGSGSYNTAVGAEAAHYNSGGFNNVAVGYGAGSGQASMSGYGNAALLGYQAGNQLWTGSDNVFLGYKAGYSVKDGNNNIVIGSNQDASYNNASNELNIGGVLFGNLATKMVGISTRTPQAALDVAASTSVAGAMVQIWRNSGGTIVSSVSATGVMTASKFIGDGSYLTGLIETLILPRIRFTRTAVAYNAATNTKDSQCTAEFGPNYVTALDKDIAVMGGMAMAGTTYNRFNTVTAVDSSYFDPTSPAIQPNTGGTYSVACVQKYAAIRFTRATVAFDAADATKDSQCVSEFGATYMAADAKDVAVNVGMIITKSASDKAFNAAVDNVNSYLFSSSATPGFALLTGGTYSLACVHK